MVDSLTTTSLQIYCQVWRRKSFEKRSPFWWGYRHCLDAHWTTAQYGPVFVTSCTMICTDSKRHVRGQRETNTHTITHHFSSSISVQLAKFPKQWLHTRLGFPTANLRDSWSRFFTKDAFPNNTNYYINTRFQNIHGMSKLQRLTAAIPFWRNAERVINWFSQWTWHQFFTLATKHRYKTSARFCYATLMNNDSTNGAWLARQATII